MSDLCTLYLTEFTFCVLPALQREEARKQKKELSLELANLQDELGEDNLCLHVVVGMQVPFFFGL